MLYAKASASGREPDQREKQDKIFFIPDTFPPFFFGRFRVIVDVLFLYISERFTKPLPCEYHRAILFDALH